MQGRAFFLRPDTPAEGKVREPRPGEEDGLLTEPLRTYAAEASLIMRRPSLTPYTILAQEATEYAQEQGQFDTFHRGASWWITENDEGRPRFTRMRREDAEHPIEKVGKELRAMMPWLKEQV